MAGMHRRVVAFLLPALVMTGFAAPAARAPRPLAAGSGLSAAGEPLAASTPAPSAGRSRAGALPDSLLARVGNGRDITVSQFRIAWSHLAPPERPDSLTPQTAREFLQLLIGKEALGEAALREPWVWTEEESAGYVALRDHLVLRAMLDSTLDV